VVLVLAVLPSLSIPGNPDDKLLHIAAFSVLTLLAAGAFPQIRLRSLWIWLVGFAAAIEMIQLLMQQGREADWNERSCGGSLPCAPDPTRKSGRVLLKVTR